VVGVVEQIVRRAGRRSVAAAVGSLLALGVMLSMPQLLGPRVEDAFAAARSADARWLWVAGVGFAVSVLSAAGSWRSALGLCGGRVGLADAAARFGIGSLVNTFVPARAGDAARIALFSRSLDEDGRLWRTGGAFVALEAARALVFTAVAVAGATTGALPLWPVAALLGLAATAAAVAFRARSRTAGGRAAHVLDAFRTLGREPARGARLVGWVALSVGGRIAAAAAIGAALGIARPLTAALVIVPALDVAGTFPLTPGNLGITSGAVAMAFRIQGIPFAHGLAAGIAFQAVETAVGVAYGLGSLVWLAPYPTVGVRKIALLAAGASASLAVAGALGATVIVPLV
jgi:uncharacterized membrane protein YbhN (UPF0104 family)